MGSMKESRFTRPRSDCPNPEYWTSTDSDSTEIEVSRLVAGFILALQPECVVETGTAFGQTAELIGKALQDNGHGKLYSLEVDSHRVNQSRIRCKGLPVEVVHQNSLDFMPGDPIDFMWIDSLEHLRPKEIAHFASRASSRCVVGIHDTGPHKTWRKNLEGLLVNPLFLPTPRGVCFARLKGGIW